MKAFYCHHFELPLPEGHSFPMAKYRLLYERVKANADAWGIELIEPPAASDDDLLRVHCPDYVRRLSEGTVTGNEMRRIGFPWSPMMVERSRRSSGATMQALRCALEGDGIAVNLAGGTHHAAYDRGGGYCVFNDSVVAARYVQHLEIAKQVLIVDLDVHQGNGTAELCAGDDSIFSFSMHAAKNYPAIKPSSDLDVALPDGTGDAEYLDALAACLPLAITRARPDAVIYLAGADPYIGDRLGHLSLSKAGLAERDHQVLQSCRRHGLPVSISMAGGYAQDPMEIADIHFATVAAAHACSVNFRYAMPAANDARVVP
jgi:acetoin utilization deacetylase AcuC-like enzyme